MIFYTYCGKRREEKSRDLNEEERKQREKITLRKEVKRD